MSKRELIEENEDDSPPRKAAHIETEAPMEEDVRSNSENESQNESLVSTPSQIERIFSIITQPFRRKKETVVSNFQPQLEKQNEVLRTIPVLPNPIDNLVYAWSLVTPHMQTCIDQSKQILESMEDKNLTIAEMSSKVRNLHASVCIVNREVASRIVGAFEIIQDEGFIRTEEMNIFMEKLETEVIRKLEKVRNNAATVVNQLPSPGLQPFSSVVNHECPDCDFVVDAIEKFHPTLTEVQSAMRFIQNELSNRERQLIQSRVQELRESLEYAKNRFEQLKKEVERRSESGNKMWEVEDQDLDINSIFTYEQCRYYLLQLNSNQEMLVDIERAIGDNNLQFAAETLDKLNNILNNIQAQLRESDFKKHQRSDA